MRFERGEIGEKMNNDFGAPLPAGVDQILGTVEMEATSTGWGDPALNLQGYDQCRYLTTLYVHNFVA